MSNLSSKSELLLVCLMVSAASSSARVKLNAGDLSADFVGFAAVALRVRMLGLALVVGFEVVAVRLASVFLKAAAEVMVGAIVGSLLWLRAVNCPTDWGLPKFLTEG